MTAKRILVVDDKTYATTLTGPVLRAAGYSPAFARNRAEATRLLLDGSGCDIVLLDIAGRNDNFTQLLQQIRRLRPELPVVVLSAVTDLEFAVSAMKLGACDYLLKPLESSRILLALNHALEGCALRHRQPSDRQELERLVHARTEMLRVAMTDLERSYDITLEALGNALDLKDAETEGHSKRVTAYSIVLARAMQIDADEVKVIARGAFLHDIGKMAIPDAILAKPGKLTPHEQAIMREHCVLGYTIIKKIPFLEKASEIVFSHQEHFDGSGYSRGLKGEEIPLGARIFSVADALDAITSDRPYRQAQSFSHARSEIERCSGTQFDPQIVDIYRTLPDRLWEELREEINQRHEIPPQANFAGIDPSGALQAQGAPTKGRTFRRPTPSSRLKTEDRVRSQGGHRMSLLSSGELQKRLAEAPRWKQEGDTITREWTLADFAAAMSFVNRVAEVAENSGHHPDIDIRWNKVKLTLSSHDAVGLTDRDFALAKNIDQLQ